MDRYEEKRQQEERKLAQLIINNPELEVVCLCDEECGGEDRAVGEIAHSMIDAYTMGTNCFGEEQYYFKSDVSDPKDPDDLSSDAFDLLEAVFGEVDTSVMTDEEAFENFQNIEWTACIAVRIAPGDFN